MADITITLTRGEKFNFAGNEALGFSGKSKHLTLSRREIWQIAQIYNSGVLTEMIEDKCFEKSFRTKKAEKHIEAGFKRRRVRKAKAKGSPPVSPSPTPATPVGAIRPCSPGVPPPAYEADEQFDSDFYNAAKLKTVPELKLMCKERGITGISKLKKDEILTLLTTHHQRND